MPEGTIAIVRTVPTDEELRECRKECTGNDGWITWNDYMNCWQWKVAQKATVITNIGHKDGPTPEEEVRDER